MQRTPNVRHPGPNPAARAQRPRAPPTSRRRLEPRVLPEQAVVLLLPDFVYSTAAPSSPSPACRPRPSPQGSGSASACPCPSHPAPPPPPRRVLRLAPPSPVRALAVRAPRAALALPLQRPAGAALTLMWIICLNLFRNWFKYGLFV